MPKRNPSTLKDTVAAASILFEFEAPVEALRVHKIIPTGKDSEQVDAVRLEATAAIATDGVAIVVYSFADLLNTTAALPPVHLRAKQARVVWDAAQKHDANRMIVRTDIEGQTSFELLGELGIVVATIKFETITFDSDGWRKILGEFASAKRGTSKVFGVSAPRLARLAKIMATDRIELQAGRKEQPIRCVPMGSLLDYGECEAWLMPVRVAGSDGDQSQKGTEAE